GDASRRTIDRSNPQAPSTAATTKSTANKPVIVRAHQGTACDTENPAMPPMLMVPSGAGVRGDSAIAPQMVPNAPKNTMNASERTRGHDSGTHTAAPRPTN